MALVCLLMGHMSPWALQRAERCLLCWELAPLPFLSDTQCHGLQQASVPGALKEGNTSGTPYPVWSQSSKLLLCWGGTAALLGICQAVPCIKFPVLPQDLVAFMQGVTKIALPLLAFTFF